MFVEQFSVHNFGSIYQEITKESEYDQFSGHSLGSIYQELTEVSECDQEIPQSHTADQPKAL